MDLFGFHFVVVKVTQTDFPALICSSSKPTTLRLRAEPAESVRPCEAHAECSAVSAESRRSGGSRTATPQAGGLLATFCEKIGDPSNRNPSLQGGSIIVPPKVAKTTPLTSSERNFGFNMKISTPGCGFFQWVGNFSHWCGRPEESGATAPKELSANAVVAEILRTWHCLQRRGW